MQPPPLHTSAEGNWLVNVLQMLAQSLHYKVKQNCLPREYNTTSMASVNEVIYPLWEFHFKVTSWHNADLLRAILETTGANHQTTPWSHHLVFSGMNLGNCPSSHLGACHLSMSPQHVTSACHLSMSPQHVITRVIPMYQPHCYHSLADCSNCHSRWCQESVGDGDTTGIVFW